MSGAAAVPDAFRGFMGAYVTGVTVITSIDDNGRAHGLTCNSLTSVALDPPTLLVCLSLRSGTLTAIRQCGGFAVNVLHDGARPTAQAFASRDPDRFERTVWRHSERLRLPWLTADACALAECEVTETVLVGDHVVVFGRVLHVESHPGSPLLYGGRRFLTNPEEAA
ncbi:flavin reductase family protein [Actinoplanes sp. NEAU-A12]|uniref:Flavin reductase family protein n=1 Tax=Actinoplanes sandaracinus TaxID=3045177 RepID=A0ABT6WZK4_9ACTN|nr:flavin reductase family protein [Actinoplanes sandaracinus]MDI6105176.1 flavin reductase family protein [Actinoplanes sandaracinus]